MKKKYREIVVGGVLYGWTISNNCDGDGGNLLKIWLNKKPIYQQLYTGDSQITPETVRKFIKEKTSE
jgi:hypothetical protein